MTRLELILPRSARLQAMIQSDVRSKASVCEFHSSLDDFADKCVQPLRTRQHLNLRHPKVCTVSYDHHNEGMPCKSTL
jgi:hypothetical protein